MKTFGVSMDERTEQILEDLAKTMWVSRSAVLRLTVRFAVRHRASFLTFARRFVKARRRKRCETRKEARQ